MPMSLAVLGGKDQRRHERHRLRGDAELSWGSGVDAVAGVTGNCLDVSVYGILVEVPRPIPEGTIVRVRIRTSDIAVQARVKHCEPYGPWFRVGLESLKAIIVKETVPNIG